MKKMKILIALFITCTIASCKGQTNSNKTIKKDTTMVPNIEKFDFEEYKKRTEKDPFGFSFFRADSTKIVMGVGETPSIRETPPPPKFYEIYKEFYANGNIKNKGAVIINSGIRIGKWEYYDPQGNKTIVDEDKKYGKFSYNDMLTFLDKQKHIDLKTGKGRENINIYFDASPILDVKKWNVSYTDIDHFMFYWYEINGDTGEVVKSGKREMQE